MTIQILPMSEKLICIDDSRDFRNILVVGRVYQTTDNLTDFPSNLKSGDTQISFDGEYLGWFSKDHFITIDEWRNKQIESIINE